MGFKYFKSMPEVCVMFLLSVFGLSGYSRKRIILQFKFLVFAEKQRNTNSIFILQKKFSS